MRSATLMGYVNVSACAVKRAIASSGVRCGAARRKRAFRGGLRRRAGTTCRSRSLSRARDGPCDEQSGGDAWQTTAAATSQVRYSRGAAGVETLSQPQQLQRRAFCGSARLRSARVRAAALAGPCVPAKRAERAFPARRAFWAAAEQPARRFAQRRRLGPAGALLHTPTGHGEGAPAGAVRAQPPLRAAAVPGHCRRAQQAGAARGPRRLLPWFLRSRCGRAARLRRLLRRL